MLAEAQLKTL